MAVPQAGQTGGGQSAPGGQVGQAGQTGRARIPAISERTAQMQKIDGFFPMYWDEAAGALYLEIPRMGQEVLYVSGLSSGVGSNDIGLDRAQLGGEAVLSFQRVGPRVLMVQPNLDWRANSDNPAERKALEDAFAKSILWGFAVAAESSGRVLVDFTDFIMRDTHNVGPRLGGHRFDRTRSAVNIEGTKAFPKNTEIDVISTFVSDGAAAGGRGGAIGQIGGRLGDVAPNPNAVTVRQHHSIIELPDNNYKPRLMDPRSGYGGVSYSDYALPLGTDLRVRYINRHRLEKKDPGAARSEAVKPIIYYVDRGAPEPIRTALIEGGRWWNEAYEAAGFTNAFRVEVMPEGADPMDVRYNVIQWVHRSTRGWSYGRSISDPRTGEIIKGHVSLGSLRVRQDYLIAEGLIAEYGEGTPGDPGMLEMALARLRQLSAHEVGHTLGLSHNYIASGAGRASVMDYPHPLARIVNDSTLDLSEAYASGIGEWDRVAIAFGYQDFPEGTDVKEACSAILMSAAQRGLIFLTDQDARPQGSAHPETHLWDNGSNAVDELARTMRVRQIGLRNFGEKKIRPGTPMATLEDVLVPLYMGHRYQVEAAAKVVGGLKYTYALRGDGQMVTEIVSPEEQRRALRGLLATIAPEALALPERILTLIPPRPLGYERGREHFKIRTGITFDPLAAGEVGEIEVQLDQVRLGCAGGWCEGLGLLKVAEGGLAVEYRSQVTVIVHGAECAADDLLIRRAVFDNKDDTVRVI